MSSSSLKLFGTTGLACGFRNTKIQEAKPASCFFSNTLQ